MEIGLGVNMGTVNKWDVSNPISFLYTAQPQPPVSKLFISKGACEKVFDSLCSPFIFYYMSLNLIIFFFFYHNIR